ncbi:hypothetical protein ACQR2W_05335 [Clostridium perfringens]
MNGIKINKLRVEGDKYRRTLEFNKGLNIISGDIYSGKSLVLRLIDYIFGKGDINLNVQVALDKYCDKVFLEVEINGQVYTLRRNLKRLKTKFYIYYCNINLVSEYTPKVVEKNEYNIILAELLNIPEYKLLKNKAHSEDKTLETIGIRDIFRYVYIDQHDLGTHNFLKYKESNKARKNKYVFELIMNLVDEDKSGIKEELVKVDNEINKNKKIISGLKAFLTEGGLEEKISIENEKEILELKINEYTKQKEEIKNKIRENKPIENPLYKKILQDKISNIKLMEEVNDEIDNITLELINRRQLKKSYTIELEELEATKEVNYKLETINHKMNCPLCNSILENTGIGASEEPLMMEGLESELKKKEELLIDMINSLEEKKNILINDKEYYESKIAKLSKILTKYENNNSVNLDYIDSLEEANNFIRELSDELQIYQEAIKVHNKIKEKELENIKKEEKKDKLNKKVDGLIKDNDYRKRILDKLNKNYRLLLENLNYDIDSKDTYINENTYIPYYNGASVYEHDSGGVLVCIQIAYLGAIILTGNNYSDDLDKNKICMNLGDFKHPNFLMLDTIGKYLGSYKSIYVSDDEEVEVMDEQTYKGLYSILDMVSSYAQIILVDNTPPGEESKYIKYIFRNKNKSKEAISEEGLINLSLNEFK